MTEPTEPAGLTPTQAATPGSFSYPLNGDYDPLKLVSPEQIAEHFGVDLETVEDWRREARPFPQPVKRLATGPLYLLGAVSEWCAQRPGAADG